MKKHFFNLRAPQARNFWGRVPEMLPINPAGETSAVTPWTKQLKHAINDAQDPTVEPRKAPHWDTQTSTSPTARMIRTVEEVITARASKQLTARRIARQVAAGRGTTPNEQPTARQRLPASVLVLQMPSPPRLRTLGEQAR